MSDDRAPLNGTNVLVLGTADWNQPIATNQHYVVRELAERPSVHLQYMESMGLRRPQMSLRDAQRILLRIRHTLQRSTNAHDAAAHQRPVPRRVEVVPTVVAPLHSGPFRPLNRRLLLRQVATWRNSPGPRILLTYTPVTYDLEQLSTRTFYHCVDILGMFPGIDNDLIQREERRLAKAGVQAIGTSQVVVDHLRAMGFSNPLLAENVADFDVYRDAPQVTDRRGVVFAGNLSSKKIDINLLNAIADSKIPLTLAGPIAEGGGNASLFHKLVERPEVAYLGVLDPQALAETFARNKVGIIPYVLNDYTRGVSPLKVYEYLAAGLSVASTNIPGVHGNDTDVFVSGDNFPSTVSRLASMPISETDTRRRQQIAQTHSWKQRGDNLRALMLDHKDFEAGIL